MAKISQTAHDPDIRKNVADIRNEIKNVDKTIGGAGGGGGGTYGK